MKTWFSNLSTREKKLIGFGGSGLVILLIYTLIWSPLSTKAENLTSTLKDKQALVDWVSSQATQVNLLRSQQQNKATKSRQGQSLLGLTDSVARANQLDQSIKRIQPLQGNKVQVWFDAAPFNQVVIWLAELEQYGISIDNVKLKKQRDAGLVNAEVIVIAGSK